MADRILVVDDEEPIREIVASMLSTAGYACKQAASGMEALAVLTSGEEFELMLSDLMMADLDGIGLLERTKEKYPDMPVVMVPASTTFRLGWRLFGMGQNTIFLNPANGNTLWRPRTAIW